jgi:hypothetical protein
MAAMATVLPRVLMEYTTEDAARFEEDMARTDKMLDRLEGRVAACYFSWARGIHDTRPVIRQGGGGGGGGGGGAGQPSRVQG